MDKYEILRQYFGHAAFRPGQEALIDSILAGRDALGVMPTGGGKSMCYQVPALLLPGLTLVISPLISLMKDQVAALRGAGVPAAFLSSGMDGEAFRAVYGDIRAGRCRLVYAAPERLESEGFAGLLRGVPLSLVAVDEAHCISQWGQDFRPSYLKIPDFVGSLPRRPVVAAFTATATQAVREDIARLLALDRPETVVTGFDRPNLYFAVERPKNKLEALFDFLQARPGRSGIVYCATRDRVDKLWQALNDRGVPAARYHAGLPEEERRDNQDDFQYDRRTVMIATNAFGMGIDKSNVSFVLHYNMPKSLEAYYQEAGRAGRDGEAADCVLLYSPGDVTTAKFLLDHGGDNQALSPGEREEVRRQDRRRLDAMIAYCKTTGCLRGNILEYFGQPHPEACGRCGNCRGEYIQADITVQAQKILSCVRRIRDKLGYSVGAGLVLRTLSGSRDRRLLALGLDQLSTYGLLADEPRGRVRDYAEFLEAQGYLVTEPTHSTLRLTPRAGEVLFRGERVVMPQRREDPTPKRRREDRPAAPAPQADSGLLAALKQERNRLAQRENVPGYIIFSNATLADMAAKAPGDLPSLLNVSGVGAVKAARYGEAFLRVIRDFQQN